MTNPSTDESTPHQSPPSHRNASCFRWIVDTTLHALGFLMLILVFLPIIVLGIAWMLFSFLCVGIFVLIYYSVTKDPLPLGILLGYGYTSSAIGSVDSVRRAPNREDVVKYLIVRELLAADPVEDSNNDTGNSHEEICRNTGPVSVKAEHLMLRFSAPLVPEITEEDATLVPRYHLPETNSSPDDDTTQVLESNTQENSAESPKGSTNHSEEPPTASEDVPATGSNNNPMVSKMSAENTEAKNLALEQDIEIPTVNMNNETASKEASHNTRTDTGGFLAPDVENRSSACCDICFSDYEVGDHVAWSQNLACVHAYHKACILDWLEQKLTCPICRHGYKLKEEPKQQ